MMLGSLIPDSMCVEDAAPTGSCQSDNDPPTFTLTKGSVYEYYVTQLYPAIVSSLPILFKKLAEDSKDLIVAGARKLIDFILPNWSDEHPDASLPTMKELWEVASAHSPSDFILRNFDTDGDGHISSTELLNMTEILKQMMITRAPETWATWFRRE